MVLKQKTDACMGYRVWEWCKNVWYSNLEGIDASLDEFENDVKMYGTQTSWEE